jgi:hypothetical protein
MVGGRSQSKWDGFRAQTELLGQDAGELVNGSCPCIGFSWGSAHLTFQTLWVDFLRGQGIPCPHLFAEAKENFDNAVDLSLCDTPAFCSRMLVWAVTGLPLLDVQAQNPILYTPPGVLHGPHGVHGIHVESNQSLCYPQICTWIPHPSMWIPCQSVWIPCQACKSTSEQIPHELFCMNCAWIHVDSMCGAGAVPVVLVMGEVTWPLV